MSDTDAKQLEELRAEVAALKAARKQQAAEAVAQEAEEEDEEEVVESKSIQGQLEDLMELLEQEIQDMPAVTALAVFSLGVLMGRFVR